MEKKIQKAYCPTCHHSLEYKEVRVVYCTMDALPELKSGNPSFWRTEEKEEAFLHDIMICPVCGTLVRYQENTRGYDVPFGTPYSIEYGQIIKSPEYQAIANNPSLPLLEKKLRLMQFFPSLYGDVDILWAHYLDQHHPKEAKKHLLNAIKDIEDGNLLVQYTPTSFMHGHGQRSVREFVLTERILLIDLYRRTEQFEKAEALIDKMWFAKHTNASIFLYEWLDVQSEMIAAKDSSHAHYFP